jgi:hypothetical protein
MTANSVAFLKVFFSLGMPAKMRKKAIRCSALAN